MWLDFDVSLEEVLWIMDSYFSWKQRFEVRVNPISLSYPFPFVLPLALVPRNRVLSARGENIPL